MTLSVFSNQLLLFGSSSIAELHETIIFWAPKRFQLLTFLDEIKQMCSFALMSLPRIWRVEVNSTENRIVLLKFNNHSILNNNRKLHFSIKFAKSSFFSFKSVYNDSQKKMGKKKQKRTRHAVFVAKWSSIQVVTAGDDPLFQ